MAKNTVGRLIKSMYGTQDASHIEHSAAFCHNSKEDVRVTVHGDVFVCLSDDDGLNYIDKFLKAKYTAKDMGTPVFDDSDVKSRLLLTCVQSWKELGH